MDLPAKKTWSARVKKTISAASVFKRQKSNIDQGNSPIQATLRNSKFAGGDADATALLITKSHSSSRSAVKKEAKKGFSKQHPLGVAFRDACDKYRGHLYNTTSLKITKTLESLLHNLYKSNPQVTAPNSSQQDPNASPLKLSALAKYECLATQLHKPISQFKLSLWRIDSKGKDVRFVQTLETRMLHYDELIAKETTKLGTLQKEWESVVSEIWKLGTTCLGDEAMAEMLFTEEGLHEQASPPSPSGYRNDKLPHTPSFSEDKTKELEKMVEALGKQEMDAFRKIEKDHQAYWKKKTAQLASALKSD